MMRQEKVFELRSLLTDLRAGLIPEGELFPLIHKFGHEGFLEAKAEVEKLLKHTNPALREIALSVLTLHWGCEEHRSTCETFLLEDPSSDNRRLGAASLGSLLRGARDPKALSVLLQVFRNKTEEWHVRDTAYCAILDLLGVPRNEHPPASRELDYTKDVDWKWIEEAEGIVRSGGLTLSYKTASGNQPPKDVKE